MTSRAKYDTLIWTTARRTPPCISTGSRTKITWSISTERHSCLAEAANELRQHPTAEGFTIKGPKRTSGRLFVPDLTFGEHIEMGENIFFYMGEMQECYVIYWLDAPVAQ